LCALPLLPHSVVRSRPLNYPTPALAVRQVEWPGVEGGVAVPDDIKPVQLYSANLFDFGEGQGTHVLATLASKTLAKSAAQLQAAVALDAMQVRFLNGLSS
jgi:hypothetical protein